ncbi:MAG: hypothetical protein RQ936_08460 [Gammaproteobacteria bacterium]|nr:hypothetical protein [Gammaproteobacteria bacterium]
MHAILPLGVVSVAAVAQTPKDFINSHKKTNRYDLQPEQNLDKNL